MSYQTIKVRFEESVCYIQFYRPEAKNTINELMIEECCKVLSEYEESAKIIVFEGLPEFFCLGADFNEMQVEGREISKDPVHLYDLWMKMATGPYITISLIRGKVNAGGVGFVAASDIVLADNTAQFALSELLFGLIPAIVMPYLFRRIGFQKANYLTIMTQPITAKQALDCGLVDAYDTQCETLLRKHLLRLRRLPKSGITRYKNYVNSLNDTLSSCRLLAVEANKEMFTDTQNLERIDRFVKTGQLS